MKAEKRKKEKGISKRTMYSETSRIAQRLQNINKELLHEKILERAYLIWEEKGRSSNTELENWVQAEREITVE